MARTLGDAFVRVRADTSTLGRDIGQGVEQSSKGLGSRLGGFAKAAGVAMGAAGAYGAVRFAQSSVQVEKDFGRTMNVLKATLGVPREGMRSLTNLAMKMGAQTAFSANEASDAMLELARGGMTTAQIKGGALSSTMVLASAGQMKLGESANYIVKGLGQFNLRASQAGEVASALAGAANASSASVHDLGFSLSAAGLAANSVGFSIQETTGILAAFSNKGLEGSDAGTSLKTMLDRLQPATEGATGALIDLGAMTEDGRNKFLKANGEYKSAAQVAEVLRKGTEDLSSSERKRLITQAFGSDAQRAATILSREGAAGIREMVKATSDQDAAQRAAAANMKGTAGALDTMGGAIETAQLAFGKAIKPLTIFGAQVVTQIANGAVPIFQDLGRVLRQNLKDVDLSGIQRAMGSIDFGAIFQNAKAGLGDLGAAIQGVDWGGVREGLGKGTTDVISVFGVVVGFAADHLDELARYLPLIIAGFVAYKVAQAAANVVSIARIPLLAAEIASNFALAVANRQLAAQLAIMNGVQRVGLVTRIRSTAASVAQTTATIAQTVATRVASGAARVWTATQWLLNAALTANPIGLVVLAIGLLVAAFVLAWKHSQTFRRIVTGAWDKVKEGADWLWDKIKAFFGWLGDGFGEMSDLAGRFRKAIGNAWDSVQDATRKAVLFVVDKVLWLADKMLGAMAKAFSWVPGLGGKLKKASDAVAKFRGDVNKEMDRINDEDVKVTVRGYSMMGGHSDPAGELPRARGGPIPWVPGAKLGKDSVRVLAMPGEHYLTAGEVRQAGGHGAIFAIRDAIRRGTLKRGGRGSVPVIDEGQPIQPLANGGPVFDVATHLPPAGPIIRARNALARREADEMHDRLKEQAKRAAAARRAAAHASGAGTPNGNGGLGPAAIRAANFVRSHWGFGGTIGGYSYRNIAGTNTLSKHAIGKAIDIMTPVGPLAQSMYNYFSGPGYGRFGVDNVIYNRGIYNRSGGHHYYSGVNPHTDHVHVDFYDRGGVARRKGALLKNAVAPERVLSPRQTVAFERLVDYLESGRGGRGGPLVNIEKLEARDEDAAMRAASREALKLAAMLRLAT